MEAERFPYTIQIRSEDEVRERFLQKAELLVPFFAVDGINATTLSESVADPRVIDSYLSSMSLVQYVVEQEVDSSSDSTARLGLNPTTVEPRLGGYFRDRLQDPTAQLLLAVDIEDLLLAAFAACAARPNRPEDAWVHPPLDFAEKGKLMSGLFEEFSSGVLEEVVIAAEPELGRLKRDADELGLTKGLMSFRKKAVINANGYAYMRLGSMLWQASI